MRKSPVWVAKWVVGGIKLALTRPVSDKAAKLQTAVWSFLLLIVLGNLTMAVLLGTMGGPIGGFTVGFTLVGLCVYAVCLRWALKGLQYRAMLRREASDRKAFNQIVSGL